MLSSFWVLVLLPATLHAQDSRLERTKALCREYIAGFVHPDTDLAYGKRLDGPKGIGALEKPEEIAAGRVNGVDIPMGYGSGIEDLAYHNALFLYALCDAEEKTGDPYFADLAHRIFRGLKRMSELSPHKGFVPRGPHPDGKSYYKDSSLDQHTLYLCGLWRFYRSKLSTDEEKAAIRKIVGEVVGRLKSQGWAIQVEDGKTKSWEGGSMLVQDGKMPLVLLCMVCIAADVLGDATLRADYERFATEDNGRRFASLARPVSVTQPRRYTMFQNQHIVRGETLRRIETTADRRDILRRRTIETADDMLTCSYFQAFRALEWLGGEPLNDPTLVPSANKYLAPLDLTFDSPIKPLELLKKYDPKRNDPPTPGNHGQKYEAIALANPAMVCQIALFSEKPEAIAAIQPSVDHLLTHVDWSKVNQGWAINYGTLAALWNLAQDPASAKPASSPVKPAAPAVKLPGPEYGRRLDATRLGVGPVMDVAAEGDRLYAIGGGALSVLERVDGRWKVLGKLAGLGHVRQIAVGGGHTYVTAREDGLSVVDVRDPQRPTLAARYDTAELATGIALSGQVLAVANRFAGVELLDVTRPAQPRHLATVRVGEAQSVVFHGPWLYAGIWQTDEVAVIDVRNPHAPRHVRSVPLDGHGDGLDVRGNLLAVATGHHARGSKAAKPGDTGFGAGHGVEFFDVTDPAEPRFLSRLKLPPLYRIGMDMWGVALAGDHAFVNDTYNGLFVIEVRDPAGPKCVAHHQLPVVPSRGDPSPVAGLAVSGGRVFLAGGWDDLHEVDPGVTVPSPGPFPDGLTVPPAPPRAADARFTAYRTTGRVHAVAPWREDGRLLLVAAGAAGLHVVRLGDRLERVADYPTRGFVRDVAIHRDRVFVAEGQGGLSLWQADKDGKLTRAASYEVPGQSIHQVVLAADGQVAFLAVGTSRLEAVTIAADGTMRKVFNDQRPGLFYRMPFSPLSGDGNRILAQWHVSGLREYTAEGGVPRATGWSHPESIGTQSGTVWHRDHWLAVTRKGYVVLQPGDTRPAEQIGVNRPAGQPLVGKPSVFGDTLFVSDPFGGMVWATDLTEVKVPRPLASLSLSSHPGRVQVIGGKALVPAGHDGLVLWDYRKAVGR